MTTGTTTDAPGTVPGAVGLSGDTYGPSAIVREWIEEQVTALMAGRHDQAVPVLGSPEWFAADEPTQRAAVLRFAAARYEDADDQADRLRREVANLRAWYLADQAAQIDALQAAVREDRQALGRLPTFEELKVRRHMRPPPLPDPGPPSPGWPAAVIPGSGGRRQGEQIAGAA